MTWIKDSIAINFSIKKWPVILSSEEKQIWKYGNELIQNLYIKSIVRDFDIMMDEHAQKHYLEKHYLFLL